MRRPLVIWLAFAGAFVILLIAMGWITGRILSLERERLASVEEHDTLERSRLALWRMDAWMSRILVRENSRPPYHFDSFYSASKLYPSSLNALPNGGTLLPSPMLTSVPPEVKLYFSIDENGLLGSPQVPVGKDRELTVSNGMAGGVITAAESTLERLRLLLPSDVVRNPARKMEQNSANWKAVDVSNRGGELREVPEKDESKAGKTLAKKGKSGPSKSKRSLSKGEYSQRSRILGQEKIWENAQAQQQREANPPRLQRKSSTVSVGEFRAFWMADELVVLREVIDNGVRRYQGAWLDWSALQASMLEEITDLLPEASIVPMRNENFSLDLTGLMPVDTSGEDPLHLVALPAVLNPGPLEAEPTLFWSPLRRSLVTAWGAVLLAGLAVGMLLHGAVSISERRAAFVSAVTHELRTPLTTFQLYSEMLAEDLIVDPTKRREYLETLHSEAGRLSHLVENVLAYARLERGSARQNIETLSLGDLIERTVPRLQRRVEDAGMRLAVDDVAADVEVKVDVGAVEQILFNLVDNACKYGTPTDETEGVVHLEADASGPMALLRVRDHGSGISAGEAKRLFKPFEKSAVAAAHSAPGVGLGLALCRNLSRAVGGHLKLEPGPGATFVLELPRLRTAVE